MKNAECRMQNAETPARRRLISSDLASDFRALLNWFQQCGDFISSDALSHLQLANEATTLMNLGWLTGWRLHGEGYAPAGALLTELEAVRARRWDLTRLTL